MSYNLTTHASVGQFSEIRNRLLNDLFIAFGIAAVPGLAISIWRATYLGFQSFMLVQVFLVVCLWLLWFKREKIAYYLRAAGLLLILFIATFAALSKLGPASDSKAFMLLFAFSSMLFFPPRSALILIVGIISCMGLFGYAAVQHWIVFDLDYKIYAQHPLSWGTTIWNMGVFSAIVAYMGWRMVHGLRLQGESLQQLANRLQGISERVPGVVYQFKLRPDGSSCFPYASEKIKEIYRVSPEQVAQDATPVFSILHPDDVDAVAQSIQESAKTLMPWKMEYRVRFPDGDEKWLFANALPQKEPDNSVLWNGFITDITERKKMERIKDEFVSTVSHELRTPLTSIRGSIKLINSGVLDGMEDKRKEMLNIAEQNSERLLFLINDLLDIEKLEKGDVKLERDRIAVKSFIEEAVAENQAYAQQHGTVIVLGACVDSMINVDKQRLKQVMANLLSNACKFSPEHQPVEVRVSQEGGWLLIEVEDHGAGIPLEFRDKVFEKFTQADSSNTRATSGTGLGLSIAKKIVDLHGGEIGFQTEANAGTLFFVKLPLES